MKQRLPERDYCTYLSEINARPRQNMAYRVGNLEKEKMNTPTKITTTRIILVIMMLLGLFVFDILYLTNVYTPPTFGAGINLVYLIACVIFIIAAGTDYLDGYLARKWKQVTDLGKFLDPVADKLLVDSSLIYLCLPHFGMDTLTIPLAASIIMVIRDLVVDALRFVAASKGIVLAANIFGKLKTVFQMIAIPLIFLNGFPFSYFDANWNAYLRIGMWFIYIATLMSFLSGTIYIIQNRSIFKGENKKDD